MLNILNRSLSGLEDDDMREIVYFLIRYFKGSQYLEPEGKDFFADVLDREPTELVKERTQRVISDIEKEIGVSAENFNDEIADAVLSALADFEMNLGNNPSENEIYNASDFFDKAKDPK